MYVVKIYKLCTKVSLAIVQTNKAIWEKFVDGGECQSCDWSGRVFWANNLQKWAHEGIWLYLC